MIQRAAPAVGLVCAVDQDVLGNVEFRKRAPKACLLGAHDLAPSRTVPPRPPPDPCPSPPQHLHDIENRKGSPVRDQPPQRWLRSSAAKAHRQPVPCSPFHMRVAVQAPKSATRREESGSNSPTVRGRQFLASGWKRHQLKSRISHALFPGNGQAKVSDCRSDVSSGPGSRQTRRWIDHRSMRYRTNPSSPSPAGSIMTPLTSETTSTLFGPVSNRTEVPGSSLNVQLASAAGSMVP